MKFVKDNGVWKKNGKPVEISPIQSRKCDDSVPRIVAEEAYKEYQDLYGPHQSLERLEERGGFGSAELALLLFLRIERLEKENARPVAIGRR